jgi:GDP-4-dehydro-6-deoxy-D-mannose reductase
VTGAARVSGRVVLVTGANGFAGPHLARALAAAGARVHGAGIGAPPPDPAPAAWHACDVLDPAACGAAVDAARPDAVVHLAGQASAARSFEQPVETMRLNVTGTWNVLEAVRRAAPGARVLVVGSGEIYGPQPEGSRVAEDAPVRPVSPYALSKAAAEALALALSGEHGLDVVATRSFGHTGPGQDPRFVVPSFAQQIAAIEAGRAEPVLRVGNLEVTRDLSDVRDIARAYVALLERGVSRRAYNVCRGEGTRLTGLVERLAALARVAVRIEPDPARMRPADLPWLVGDPSLIARDTGWRGEIPLERTLAEVLEEWRGRTRG